MIRAKHYVEQRNSGYYVAGSRVSLDSVVHEFRNGASPESICDNFESLTLEQVYGAIAHYLANQTEIDAYLDRQERSFVKARRAQSHITAPVRRKLQAARRPSVNRQS